MKHKLKIYEEVQNLDDLLEQDPIKDVLDLAEQIQMLQAKLISSKQTGMPTNYYHRKIASLGTQLINDTKRMNVHCHSKVFQYKYRGIDV